MKIKFKKLSKKQMGIIVGVVAAISVAGIVVINKKPAEEPIVNLREYPVKKGDIIAGVSGGGTLVFETIDHNFDEVVTIGEIFVKEGQSVKTGDKLASISGEEIEKKLEELNGLLSKANIALEQSKNAKNNINLNNNKAWNSAITDSENQYETEKNQAITLANKLKNDLERINREIESVVKKLEELSVDSVANKLQIDELNQKQTVLNTEKNNTESQLNDSNINLQNIEVAREKKLEQEKSNRAVDNEINNSALRDADNAIKLAEIEVDRINNEIGKLKTIQESSILYAKNDGVISTVGYTANAVTTLDKPVIEIGNSNKILAKVSVGENDIIKIKQGQDVNLEISAFQDEKFTGKVKEVNLKPSQQGTANVYEVTVEVDSNEKQLVDGMTLNANFILKGVKDVVMISNKAIILKDGKEVVQIRNVDGTLKDVEIETGFSDGKNSEIISGLIPSDVAVIGG
ncbi:MAG: efflux RND transporter periplasmic adaptor subunit [Clostridium sp.]